jgi:nucleoside-diphosphate-sugar epimerase
MDWTDQRVLIVGGAGFVGSNLIKMILTGAVDKIVIIDNMLSSEPENIPKSKRVAFWEGSIADDSILSRIEDEYDYIFHLATYHGNQSSIHDPIADHDNNLLTTLKLFHWIKDYKKLNRVVYSSAGCAVAEKTYDTAAATKEDGPVSLHMDSPYSISKIVGEFYAVYYHVQHGLPTVRARFQNVYGPGEILGAGKWRGTPATVWRNVTPTFIYKALNRKALPVENKGIPTRDFIYVDDICRGLVACAEKGKPGDVYNLASGQEISILELSKTINQLTQNPSGIEFLPKRPWDNSGRRFGSTEKALKELDFQASTSLSEGLKETIDWTRQNMSLIDACIAKHAAHIKSR